MTSKSVVKAAKKGAEVASTIAVSAALADHLRREKERKQQEGEYSKKFEEIPLMEDSQPLDKLNQKTPESMDESLGQLKSLQEDLRARACAIQSSPTETQSIKPDLDSLEGEVKSLLDDVSLSQSVLDDAPNTLQAGQTRNLRQPGLVGNLLKSVPAGRSLAALTGVRTETQEITRRYHQPVDKATQADELDLLDSGLRVSQSEADKLSDTLSINQFSNDIGGSAEASEQLSKIRGSSENPAVRAKAQQSASALLTYPTTGSSGEQLFEENVSRHKISAASHQVQGDFQGAGGELNQAQSSQLALEEFRATVAPIARDVAVEQQVDENQVLDAAAQLTQEYGTASREQLKKSLDMSAKASKENVSGRKLQILPVDEVAKTFLSLGSAKQDATVDDLRQQSIEGYVRKADLDQPTDLNLEKYLMEGPSNPKKALWLDEFNRAREKGTVKM